MDIDIKQIGIFGLSFSRGFDQTWFNLWRKADGYSMDLHQDVESDDDDDDEVIDTVKKISFEQGEQMLAAIMEQGHAAEWKPNYNNEPEAVDSDLTFTLDIDDLDEKDLLFSSGNGKLPPMAWMNGMLAAIRTGEPTFATCFEQLK